MRRLAFVVLIALIGAACSSGGDPVGAEPAGTSGSEAAPDFTLPLGDGGTFVLSDETRPVFMVFWAEW